MKTKEWIVLTIAMAILTASPAWAAHVILNEYNAVGSSDFLNGGNADEDEDGGDASDTYFGRDEGNGGDWFELVVITDHLDMSGWDLKIEYVDDVLGLQTETLTLTDNDLWKDLRSGTIITVSEEETEDVTYDPGYGDWWINVRANSAGSGTYIEAQNFPVNNDDWTLTIKNEFDSTVFGPAGEGSGQYPGDGVNSKEVCFLGDDPSAQITPASDYDDGTDSTFGSPNPGQDEDFSSLRNNPLFIALAESSFTDPTDDVSGVIDDSTDPAAEYGINFTVDHADLGIYPEDFDIDDFEVESSNTSVVPNSSQNLVLTEVDEQTDPGLWNLQVIPDVDGVGYTNITITVSNESDELSIEFDYAASEESNTETSLYHTGFSDASTAVALDGDYMFVADDEEVGDNKAPIYLYARDQSGLPINEFDFTDDLGLDSDGGEVDIEASMCIGDTIYWLSSHGNNKDGECKSNRRRLFATEIDGSGATATLDFVEGTEDDYCEDLRGYLVTWDNTTNGGDYGFAAGACCDPDCNPPLPPKHEGGDGFNIEGLVMAPDNTTAYICFRAPVVGGKAVILPIVNFVTWFQDGLDDGFAAPTFGTPIELDLGGRGIRSIDKNDDDEYLIVAGSYANSNSVQGAVGYWKMDDASTTATDSIGTHDGTLHEDAGWTDEGRIDGALTLDGDGDYVSVPHHSSLNPGTGSFSISCWIRADVMLGAQPFIWKNDGEEDYEGYYAMLSGTTLGIGFGDGTYEQEASMSDLEAYTWYHVVAIRDADSEEIRLYVDGQLEDEGVDLTGDIDCTDQLEFAGSSDSSEFFGGLMDEISIFNRALSATEVDTLSFFGNTGGEPFALYIWTGDIDDAPGQLTTDPDLALLTTEAEGGSIEAIVEMPQSVFGGQVQFLLDNGTADWYGDARESKILRPTFQKFRSDLVTIDETCFPYDSNPDDAQYVDWVKFGRPDCWCYARQCYGDADGYKQGHPVFGETYVGTDDLDVLIDAWTILEPDLGPGLSGNQICADFDHAVQGHPVFGLMRVGTADLAKLIDSWQVLEPPLGDGIPADCVPNPVEPPQE